MRAKNTQANTSLHSTPCFPSWRAFLAPLGRRAAALLPSLRQATLTQIEERFAPALPPDLLPKPAKGAHSRERVYTLSRTVWCWIWQILQGHTACREAVRQVQALFALHAAGPVSEDTGAYCLARGALPCEVLEKLLAASAQSVQRAAPAAPAQWLQGRPVRVVDGSGSRLADTPANRAAYPPSSSMVAGTGFPLLRLVVLFCLHSGALLAVVSGSLLDGEWRLWHRLCAALRPGDIMLGDRAYGNYVVAAILRTLGVDLLATVPARLRRVDFRRAKQRLASRDALFVWRKSRRASPLLDPAQWAQLPEEITVRLLRVSVERRGFRTHHLILVTTLLDPQLYPAKELVATHARRWRLEMSLDDLKTTLGMEHLRSQSPAMVQKDLLVFLIAHNLVRWLMAQAASQENVALNSLSFKGTMDAFRQWSQALAQCRSSKRARIQLWQQLLAVLAADALPDRPGRHEPRAVKKRSKYPYLKTRRRLYQQPPSRNQRRRAANARRRSAKQP